MPPRDPHPLTPLIRRLSALNRDSYDPLWRIRLGRRTPVPEPVCDWKGIESFSRDALERPLRRYQLEIAQAVAESVANGLGRTFVVAMPRQAGASATGLGTITGSKMSTSPFKAYDTDQESQT